MTDFGKLPARIGAVAAFVLASLGLALGSLGCGGEPAFEGEVVVYCAHGSILSEPILKSFEERAGIRVKAVFDAEATKTVGLVSRIEAERDRPRCDVFWNNEPSRTVRLAREGLLEPYDSPSAEDIPERYRDPERLWTGFAARARVVIYNTETTSPDLVPTDFAELTDERWQGRFAMARPIFGTTATHAAVLFTIWGESKARLQFELLAANGVVILDGNALTARAVAEGELPVALTDTDDATMQMSQGRPVDWMPFDHDGEGMLLIPNTVALVKGGPNPEHARKLIDHILSEETEARLASSSAAQIPVRPKVPAPPRVAEMARAKALEVDWKAVEANLEPSAAFLAELFAGP